MRKFKFFYCVLLLFIAIFLTGCSRSSEEELNQSKSNTDDTKISRTSTTTNTNQESENRIQEYNEKNNEETIIRSSFPETEISSFSTVLKYKPEGRLNNIKITCSKLNNTIVQNGETFSFCQTTGNPTEEEGYKKAEVFSNGKTIQSLGGGNCQVSTTLYNAVLGVQGLTVTERHEHGKDVNYVPEGKDAAVSYGSLDLKFNNNTGYAIKILASTDEQNVTVKIFRIS